MGGRREYVRAAKQAFAHVSPAARTDAAVPRALVAAEIAYAENDGDARHSRARPDPGAHLRRSRRRTTGGSAAAAPFSPAHPVEGTRALVERERYLTDPAALRANRDELFERIRTAAERGAIR